MLILIKGSTGQEVKNLQTALNYHLPGAMPLLTVDGIFGPKTDARVKQFQTLYRLTVDGVVGLKTHHALYCFVDCSHHLIPVIYRGDKGRPFATRNLLVSGNAPPSPSPFLFPPLPRMQLPFPQTLFPPVPSILQLPRLELDPKLLFLIHQTKWELEAGQETSFKTDLRSNQKEREVALVGDVKGTVWSKPIGKHLELSAGGGMAVEKRIKPSANSEASIYIFAKAEIKDVLKISPLDLAKVSAEAQVKGKLGSQEPPDMSVSIGGGPEVEVFNGKVTFGPGGYFQYETNGETHIVSGQVKLSGTFHF